MTAGRVPDLANLDYIDVGTLRVAFPAGRSSTTPMTLGGRFGRARNGGKGKNLCCHGRYARPARWP